jgi:peptidyl-prolyl cis-trans isomerase C
MSSLTFIRTRNFDVATALARGNRYSLRKIVHEPLVHFLLLGVLIFAASAIVNKHREDAARRIVIDENLVMHFVTLYEAQMGAIPSKSQLDAMIEGYIREEVQFREAKRMGLDNDDQIVRRRMASKFDFLQRDLVAVPDPSGEELRRYYESHQKDFLQSASVTFTHIYFSPDHGGDLEAHSRAEQALAKLQSESVTRAPGLGDRFALQTDYAGVARLDLVQQFGDKPIVESLFTNPVNRWSGPVRSGYGWHLIYVSHREEAKVPPLNEIQNKVRMAYMDAAKEKANQEKYDALQKQYIIERAFLR